MASRSISAILWTLVSVNVITLVVGGLTTWLGYAIPVRLKQFGLLPELVIVAGFASLIVACIGLCALNYSSYHALNIYGFSCSVFVLMLVFGIPETWYKSSQFGDGSLLRDIIYFALVIMLTILLISAFTFAQYLRRKDLSNTQGFYHGDHHLGGCGGCNSSPYLCADHHHQTPFQAGDDMSSNINHQRPTSIIDKWLPWNTRSNNLDEMRLAPRKNCCPHLSNDHIQATHQSNTQFSGGGRGGGAGNDFNDNDDCNKPIIHNNDQTIMNIQSCVPLIHRGFYRNTTASNNNNNNGLVRAKSFNQPLNELQPMGDYDNRIQEESQVRVPPASCGPCNQSNQSLVHASRDDSLVQYGGRGEVLAQQIQYSHYHLPAASSHYSMTNRYNHHHHHHHHHNHPQHGPHIAQHRGQSSAPKCNCHLGSSALSMGSRQNIAASLDQGRYLSYDLASSTMPRLHSHSSSYAMRCKPAKIRSKGSSSVVAMTAAAAVALFGGVATDTCSARPNETSDMFTGASDGVAGGGGDVDASLLDRCILDSNNHQLSVSMQNDLSSNIHRSVCRQPVLDFAPLLDFRKP